MASGFTVGRNAQNGLPETVSDAGLTLSRTFNGYGEVDGSAWTVNSAGVYSWSVTQRDGAGRIKQKTETLGGTTTVWDYAYDAWGRLTEVKRDNVVVESYTHDANGNRETETNALRSVGPRTYAYDAEDALITVGSESYGFDLDGFLSSRTGASGTAAFTYSSRGELLSATLPGSASVTYGHDALGRRVAKYVGGILREKYLWAGRTTLLAVYDGTGALKQRFLYADSRMPVAMQQDGATYYLAYDQVGSLRAVIDATGTIIKRIDYDTFGNVLNDTNPAFTVPFGFAGGLHDRDTNLVRFGARDYDPELGRWTAKDPIDFAGGDVSLYNYVLADPVNWVDPEGLFLINVSGGLGGIDFSAPLYDTDRGWRYDSKTEINAVTALIGGGVSFEFENPWINEEAVPCEPESDLIVSWGLGKYLGFSYNTDLSKISINIGLGLSLPITFSGPIDSVIGAISDAIYK